MEPHVASWAALPSWDDAKNQCQKGDPVGHGTFGTVYDGKFGSQTVAIKSVICQDDSEIRLLLNEIELLKKCAGHRNIVSLLSAYRTEAYHNDILYRRGVLVFERCLFDGMEFVHLVPPSTRTMHFLSLDLFSGMEWLYQLNILHNDIKPGNLLLSTDNERLKLQVADFGTCKEAVLLVASECSHYRLFQDEYGKEFKFHIVSKPQSPDWFQFFTNMPSNTGVPSYRNMSKNHSWLLLMFVLRDGATGCLR